MDGMDDDCFFVVRPLIFNFTAIFSWKVDRAMIGWIEYEGRQHLSICFDQQNGDRRTMVGEVHNRQSGMPASKLQVLGLIHRLSVRAGDVNAMLKVDGQMRVDRDTIFDLEFEEDGDGLVVRKALRVANILTMEELF